MGNIWIVCETPELAAQLLGGALEFACNDEICAVAFSKESARELSELGANKVYEVESARPEQAVSAIVELIRQKGAVAVLFGATPRGRGMAASIAAGLNAGLASEAIAITREADEFTAKRYVYGGNGVTTVTFSGIPCFTILPGVFAAPSKKVETPCAIEPLPIKADSRVELVESAEIPPEGVDITRANRIVCFGRGVDKQEDMRIIEELAGILQAEVACSRGMAEDLKWLPLDRYIGISGAKVQPELHISVGVSGQVQHVAGIRDAKIIVAIDKNENAPIFQAADYGIVGDLYQVVPALNEALKA